MHRENGILNLPSQSKKPKLADTKDKICFKPPFSLAAKWTSACPNSLNYLPPKHTHPKSKPLPEQTLWLQSLGTRANTSWGFEYTETGRQRGGILSQGQEENRTFENCKAKNAKRESSLSQLLTIEISPHLGMTSADLIFCHQSLRTCFNYAAHQQKFSF